MLVLRMITSNDFPSPKERHLQLSSWISKVGSYPSEHGEALSSLEAIHSVHSLLAPSEMPHPEIQGHGWSLLGQMPCWRLRP